MRPWIALSLLLILAVDVTLDAFCADAPDSGPVAIACVGDFHAVNPPDAAMQKVPQPRVPHIVVSAPLPTALLADKKFFHPPVRPT